MFKSKNSSLIIASILAAGAFLWLATGTISGSQSTTQQNTQDKINISEPERFKVQVAEFIATPLVNSIHLQGQIEAYRRIEIKSETSGLVEARLVDKGDVLKKGEPLLRVQVNHKKLDLEHAKAQLLAIEAEYSASKKLLKAKLVSSNQHKQTQAELAQAKARVKQLAVDIQRTTIAAAFDGVLNEIQMNEGDFLSVGDPIATLVDNKSLIISANVPQSLIYKLRLGLPIRAELISGRMLQGQLTYISQEADPQTRTFRVESRVHALQDMPVFGQSASVTIDVDPELAHQLPNSLLDLSTEGILQVKAVSHDDTVINMQVNIIRSQDSGTYVSGLPEKVRLITVGQGFVKAGQLVTPELKKASKE